MVLIEIYSMLVGSSITKGLRGYGIICLGVQYNSTTIYVFYYLEDEDKLLPSNHQHICGLHYVYLPQINQTLKHFCDRITMVYMN